MRVGLGIFQYPAVGMWLINWNIVFKRNKMLDYSILLSRHFALSCTKKNPVSALLLMAVILLTFPL
jgi:hypothetical protein